MATGTVTWFNASKGYRAGLPGLREGQLLQDERTVDVIAGQATG
jgi:hypothetical protein